jgi:hypothetical protein
MPRKSPLCVPLLIERTATRSPQATTSSCLIVKSGKTLRSHGTK